VGFCLILALPQIQTAERIGKLLKKYERKEGAVKDLAEKLEKGELK